MKLCGNEFSFFPFLTSRLKNKQRRTCSFAGMFAFPSCVVGRHVGFQALRMTALCTQ